jgi:hypothetical protein
MPLQAFVTVSKGDLCSKTQTVKFARFVADVFKCNELIICKHKQLTLPENNAYDDKTHSEAIS